MGDVVHGEQLGRLAVFVVGAVEEVLLVFLEGWEPCPLFWPHGLELRIHLVHRRGDCVEARHVLIEAAGAWAVERRVIVEHRQRRPLVVEA